MVWPGDDQGYTGGRNPGGWHPPSEGPYPPSGDPYGGYGGPPAFPPPPPPQRGASTGIIVVVAIIVVVLLGAGVGTAVTVSMSRHGKHSSPPLASSPSYEPSYAPPPGAVPSSAPPARAKVPGWKAVVAVKQGVTYDVPPDAWKVETPGTIVGFEDPTGKPEVSGSGAATYKEGDCQGQSGSWRAQTAVAGYRTADAAADARDAALKWATFGYTPDDNGGPPTVRIGAARPLNAGGVTGQEVSASVTVYDNNPCSPPRAVVYTVAVPLKTGEVAVLVVMADQGVSDQAADANLRKIAASVRPTA